MKSKLRRAFGLILVGVMLMGLCACAQTEKPGTTVPRPAGGKYYWEMLNEVSDTSELPNWTGETLEINVWCAAGTQALFGTLSDTNVTFKELERVTGIKFNVEDSYGNNGDTIDAKLPKIIASKELPNMIFGYNIKPQTDELYENGYLVDLTEYYEQGYLDQVLELYPLEETDKYIWSLLKYENNDIYGIPAGDAVGIYDVTGYHPDCYDQEYYLKWNAVPNTAGGVNYLSTLYVRDDIVTALYPDAYTTDELIDIYMSGEEFTEEQIFDVPLESTEDLVEFLYDIKALLKSGDYVGLDGKPMEVAYGPNSDQDNWDWMETLPRLIAGFAKGTNYFANADMTAKSADEVVSYSFKSKEYIEYYKLLNSLVNDDVIAKNSLVDNNQIFTEKFNSAHYAVIYGTKPTQPLKLGKDATWSYRPVYVKMETNLETQNGQALANVSSWSIFKDTLSESQIEQLLHAINYIYSDVGVKNFLWGPKSAGLFTEDENGNRTYTTEELKACMLLNNDNGENIKYGLINTKVGQLTFAQFPYPASLRYQTPAYLYAPYKERQESEALQKYCPGVFEEYSAALLYQLPTANTIYRLGIEIEGVAEFWAARAGFESQMKKMLAATPDKFDQEMQKLFEYAEDNGLTDEVLKEYNDLFVEANREYLQAYGVID